jgi:hypothetical protein
MTGGAFNDGGGIGANDGRGNGLRRASLELQRDEGGERDAERRDDEADVLPQIFRSSDSLRSARVSST